MHATQEFFLGLWEAIIGIPSAMRDHWHESHTWDRPTTIYREERRTLPSGGQTITVTAVEDPDYKLWKLLGVVGDSILIAIVLVIIVAEVMAL